MTKEVHPVDSYIGNMDWRVKENANQIFCVGHLMNYLSSKYIYDYWLNNVMTKEIRNYHKEGRIHTLDNNLKMLPINILKPRARRCVR